MSTRPLRAECPGQAGTLPGGGSAPRYNSSPLVSAVLLCARRTFDSSLYHHLQHLAQPCLRAGPKCSWRASRPQIARPSGISSHLSRQNSSKIRWRLPESAFQFPPVLGTQGRRDMSTFPVRPTVCLGGKFGVLPTAHQLCFLREA